MTTSVMPATSPCGCTSTVSSPCDAPDARGLERTRFFARQLVMPDDLTQDQIYFREKMRRHNRMLHGWGVVCGSCVKRGSGKCEVIVDAGYILGPYGDEIVIESPVTIDLCTQGLGEKNGCCGEELDPWCADTRSQCPEGPLYLAVRYRECQSRPVRSMSAACGCGCDDAACEYSRIRDSYAIKLLRDLPSSYTTPMVAPPASSLVPCRDGTARACPSCPTDPWVILADITVGTDCAVRTVNCFTHRRYVVSYGSYYHVCSSAPSLGSGAYNPPAVDPLQMATMMANNAAMVDLSAPMVTQPRATVHITRADGSAVSLPANFTVRAGSTVSDLLRSEGDRQLYDAVTDRSYSLRDIFAAAKVDPSMRIDSAAAAIGLLEGRIIPIMTPGGVSATSGGGTVAAPADTASGGMTTDAIAQLIDRDGLDRLTSEHGGDISRTGELPATALVGVAPASTVGKAIASMTIADVAAMSREKFADRATEGASKRQLDRAREQARTLWETATRVVSVTRKER